MLPLIEGSLKSNKIKQQNALAEDEMKIGVNALKLNDHYSNANGKKRYYEPSEMNDEHPMKQRRPSHASEMPHMVMDPDLDQVEMRSKLSRNKFDMLDSKNTLKLSKPLFQNPLGEMEN